MAVLQPDADGLVTLVLIRGDSDDFLVTVTDDAVPPVAIDLSKAVDGTVGRRAIVRFAVKTDPDTQSNQEALVFKSSHLDDQLPFLTQAGATMGQCRVLIDKPDTEGADTTASYTWDLEVSRQDSLRSGASGGTYQVAPGTGAVLGTGTAFTKAKVGDIFQPLGALNTRPSIIDKIVDDTHMTVDFTTWQAESGQALEIRRGKHKTAARGPFTLESGVVAE
jgi:hypothetical protein